MSIHIKEMCSDAAPSTITNASSTHDLSRQPNDSDNEEDEEPLHERPDDSNHAGGGQRGTGFVNATQLKRSPGELALFLNFAIHHSDPTTSVRLVFEVGD